MSKFGKKTRTVGNVFAAYVFYDDGMKSHIMCAVLTFSMACEMAKYMSQSQRKGVFRVVDANGHCLAEYEDGVRYGS